MTICAVPNLRRCLDDADHYKSGTPIIVAGDLNLDASRSVAADLIRQANFQLCIFRPACANDDPHDHCSIGATSLIGSSRGDLSGRWASRSTLRFQLRTITHSLSRSL